MVGNHIRKIKYETCSPTPNLGKQFAASVFLVGIEFKSQIVGLCLAF